MSEVVHNYKKYVFPDLLYIIAGEGPEYDCLLELSVRLKLDKNVLFQFLNLGMLF